MAIESGLWATLAAGASALAVRLVLDSALLTRAGLVQRLYRWERETFWSRTLGPFAVWAGWTAALPWRAIAAWSARWRRRVFELGFPDMLDALAAVARTELAAPEAFARAARLVPGPLGDELRRLSAELSTHPDPEVPLRAFADRTGVAEIQDCVRAILQERRSGARLVELFAHQGEFARRMRLQSLRRRVAAQPYVLTGLVGLLFINLFVVFLAPRVAALVEVIERGF